MYRRAFVGREAELQQLKDAFDAALSGQGGLVLVVGEPGIGKTSLCEQLATYVAVRGGRTLIGHCHDGEARSLPYLPFVEALRTYVLSREPERLQEELGSGAIAVAQIVSEVRGQAPKDLALSAGTSTSSGQDPAEARSQLLEAVIGFLRNAAAVQPLLMVLEDLQDADRGTLDLLTHLARRLDGTRLLVVGTYRDIEVDRTHPLAAALAELRRGANFSRVLLRGLTADEVQRMVGTLAGYEESRDLAEAVHRQTEGNPLFVQEVLRHLIEEGLIRRESGRWRAVSSEEPLAMHIPEGLRDVIGRRLTRLSPECNRVLAVAAVIGREFRLETLQAVVGPELPDETLITALEEATHVAVLQEEERPGSVRYRFAHAFFRQALYEELSAPRRLRLHQQVARALEARYAGRLAEHAAELAEHFAHSTDAADLTKAVSYAELAAGRAMAVYAYGEAARLLEQALQVQETLNSEDQAKRCDLLLALGEALLPAREPRRVVDTVAPEALALAEAIGDRPRASRACQLAMIGLERYGAGAAASTPAYQRWVERADRYAAPDSTDRVRADLALNWVKSMTGAAAEARALRRQALDLARRLNDWGTLADAAWRSIDWPDAPGFHAERMRVVEEFLTWPREELPTRPLGMLLWRSGTLCLDCGDRARAEALWQQLTDLAARTRDTNLLLQVPRYETILATLDGQLELAVETTGRLASLAGELGLAAAGRLYARQVGFRSLLYLGRADDALAALPAPGDQAQPVETWMLGPQRALCFAHLGRTSQARASLDRFLSERGGDSGDDGMNVIALVILLETALLLEDRELTAMAAERLAPAATIAIAEFALSCVARHLGAAAALRGDGAAARGYYERALEMAGRVRFRPEIALARYQLAELLLAEANDGGADTRATLQTEALSHLNFAISEFRGMQMQPALERALRLKVQVQGIPSGLVITSIDAVTAVVQEQPPDLRAHAAPDGTVTVMFTDIESSAALTERLGDTRWQALLRQHNDLVRQQIRAHGGYEVKTLGDGFMVAFGSAARALRCAIAIQRAFQAPTPGPSPNAGGGETRSSAVGLGSPSPSIGGGGRGVGAIRIGLHTGEAIRDADDFFGRTVIVASRIAAQARGGEILVSGLLRELTESSGEFTFEAAREVSLKGLAGTQRVCAVVWR